MYIPSWIVLDVYNLVLVSVMYIFVKITAQMKSMKNGTVF